MRSQPTREGYGMLLCIAICVSLGMLGGLKGLLVVAAAGGSLILTDALWLLATRTRTRTEARLGWHSPNDAEPIVIVVIITNDSPRRSLAARLRWTDGGRTHLRPVPPIAAGETARLSVTTPPKPRGWRSVDVPRLERFGPMGLIRWRAQTDPPLRCLVRPHVEPLEAPLGGRRELELAESQRSSASAAYREFAELREYQPGDEIRRVHWPSTARRGVPVVRAGEERTARRINLVCDLSPAPHETFERTIRSCASVAAASLRGGHQVQLSMGGHDDTTEYLGVSGLERVLDVLASASPSASAAPLITLQRPPFGTDRDDDQLVVCAHSDELAAPDERAPGALVIDSRGAGGQA